MSTARTLITLIRIRRGDGMSEKNVPSARVWLIRKSHSIFDFAAKVLGLDFDAVKLRIAELLDRSDLIIEKLNGGAQKTDPKAY